jgi:hypothetical protein
MNWNSRLALGLATLALSANPARAEDPRFGVQVHGNIPTGDLKDAVDNKLGLGLGAHGTFDLGLGHVIRPRFDYTFFPETTLPSGTNGLKSKVDALSLGADYLYFIDGKPVGLYLTGGLSLNHWKVDLGDASESSNKFGLAAGVGYNFNKSFGAEFRFTTSKYGSGSKDYTASALQVGATLRF